MNSADPYTPAAIVRALGRDGNLMARLRFPEGDINLDEIDWRADDGTIILRGCLADDDMAEVTIRLRVESVEVW